MAKKKLPTKSENVVQICGELLEMNFKVETRDVELLNFNTGNRKKAKQVKVITKGDFKNPSIIIGCNANGVETQVGVNFSDVNSVMLDDDDNIITNPAYSARETVMNNYKCKTNDAEGTRVHIDYAFMKPNEYVDKNTFEFKSYQQTVNAFNITSSNVPSEDCFDGKITGVVNTIVEETNKDGEETGRLKVQMIMFDRNGRASTIDLIVEEDLADDFQNTYSAKDSASIEFEILRKQVGGRPVQKENRKGRRATNITSGFAVTEYSIFSFGDEPFEEEHKYYVSSAELKLALEERKIYKQAMIDKKKEGSAPSSGLGKSKAKDDDTLENPFKDDDDVPFPDATEEEDW